MERPDAKALQEMMLLVRRSQGRWHFWERWWYDWCHDPAGTEESPVLKGVWWLFSAPWKAVTTTCDALAHAILFLIALIPPSILFSGVHACERLIAAGSLATAFTAHLLLRLVRLLGSIGGMHEARLRSADAAAKESFEKLLGEERLLFDERLQGRGKGRRKGQKAKLSGVQHPPSSQRIVTTSTSGTATSPATSVTESRPGGKGGGRAVSRGDAGGRSGVGAFGGGRGCTRKAEDSIAQPLGNDTATVAASTKGHKQQRKPEVTSQPAKEPSAAAVGSPSVPASAPGAEVESEKPLASCRPVPTPAAKSAGRSQEDVRKDSHESAPATASAAPAPTLAEKPQSAPREVEGVLAHGPGGILDAVSTGVVDVAAPHGQELEQSALPTLPSAKRSAAADQRQQGPPQDAKLCVICIERERTHIFLPCYHYCVCAPCVSEFKQPVSCPMCRIKTSAVHRVYD